MGSTDSNTKRGFLWYGCEIAALFDKEMLDILNAAM